MPKTRAKQQYKLKPRLHIFCEGEKTEPNYLTKYIETRFPGTRLSPVRKTDKNTPVQLVEEAIAAKKEKGNPKGDKFWVVFDREAKNKYSDTLHAKARRKADEEGIHIAISNVCFEVWILLHFQNTVAPYSSYTDLWNRSDLRLHISNYEKGSVYTFSNEQIKSARANAAIMNQQTCAGADSSWSNPHQWNPYSDVHLLLDAIDDFGKKYV
ncbi:MAG: RloB domain-containing protein [Verrucomicrobia bacterium]|nr:RloB domain-containing protein [Verrucomicrobiota bacterium]MCH8526614.1 RloB family protein [Kiritimatiellia bacterium]